MNKIEMVKGSIGMVVSLGVGTIITNIVKTTSDSNANAFTKVCVMAGGFVLSTMAGKMAANHAEAQIDGIINQFKEVVVAQQA